MRRLEFIVSSALAFAVLWACASMASAHIGIAAGIGPHLPRLPAPHIGRVYWKPTPAQDTAAGYREATSGPTELDEYMHSLKRDVSSANKLAQGHDCAALRLEYIERHGVTTPRPLKGFSSCKKYALDHAYWQKRHGVERVYVPDSASAWWSTTVTQLQISVHNVVLPW